MGASLLELAIDSIGAEALYEQCRGLSFDEQVRLQYEWAICGRPEQQAPPGDWRVWLVMAGRGFGKTRCGAEWVRQLAWDNPGCRIALIGRTAADVRNTMVDGPSGILAVSPPWFSPVHEASKCKITWPNGSVALTFSAEEPKGLRGPQFSGAWCFVAGTEVETASGARPIETIETHDQVLTRRGYRPVCAVGQRAATVGKVCFSNGRFLIGTADHPVLGEHGWTRLKDLSIGSNVQTVTNTRISGHRVFTTETSGAPYSSIGGYGNRNEAPSRRGITSITSMATRQITALTTWLASQCESIAISMDVLARPLGTSLTGIQCSVESARDLSTWLDTSRARYASRVSTDERMTSDAQSESVATAKRSFSPFVETTAASVVSTWEPIGQATVHNIAVADTPEYFANGVLVHNCDELAAWPMPQEQDPKLNLEHGIPGAWTQLQFGMRIPNIKPRIVVTTTPTPCNVIRKLLQDKTTTVVRGSTYDNASNLSPSFLAEMRDKYEGTRIGRQEIYAELLEDVEGALWKHATIDNGRRAVPIELQRIVVAVDPSGSAKRTADTAGIVVAGVGECLCLGRPDTHAFVLEDLTGKYSPRDMGNLAIGAYHKYKADRLVAEDNFGGQIVADLVSLIDPQVAYKAVHASRGKMVRAEPVAALYEQGRVHHVGMFKELEDEMTQYAPLVSTESPGRLDAMVWAITDLMLTHPVTLGSGPIAAGARRLTAPVYDDYDDDDQPRGRW